MNKSRFANFPRKILPSLLSFNLFFLPFLFTISLYKFPTHRYILRDIIYLTFAVQFSSSLENWQKEISLNRKLFEKNCITRIYNLLIETWMQRMCETVKGERGVERKSGSCQNISLAVGQTRPFEPGQFLRVWIPLFLIIDEIETVLLLPLYFPLLFLASRGIFLLRCIFNRGFKGLSAF